MPPALSDATVLLAAGGTGGHLQPALAVAAEAQARGARVVVVTTPSQVERVRDQYTTYALELKGFERRLDVPAYARTFKLLAAAVPRVRRILKEARPDVAVGGGGFASGPVLAVAAASGVPGLALEADAHLGVANRLLRPFVKRFCLSFPIEGLEPPRYVVTGRPLAPQHLQATPDDGRAAFGLEPGLPVVLAFGGSQGAQSINRACVDAFGGQELGFQLVHVCGPRNEDQVRRELERCGERFERYHLVPYTDRLAAAMAAADLVVARSGGSVAELAALGKPAILVPYPYATADHQRKNAREMVANGAALLVDDAELDGELLKRLVAELLGDRDRLAGMAAASAALGRPDAARRVADQIEDILTTTRGRGAR
ncbi:MAG: UDP-N-acetylglucosamine--N-acetylmuramyl-(pentapeptide) pyrophosphoryl-undecaprenol N-acetylglucosamine transferase [Actinobacteria bacterium]|nr:UDP-N-acetylglucosamine--N-acetylmuramyl-(pentapeptide) pyrophosphoryl-undecaprenol N-acetylglucosamine transferase [Actinomycetota bacterium]